VRPRELGLQAIFAHCSTLEGDCPRPSDRADGEVITCNPRFMNGLGPATLPRIVIADKYWKRPSAAPRAFRFPHLAPLRHVP